MINPNIFGILAAAKYAPAVVASYRYWRISVSANNGAAYLSANEIEMRLTPGGVDQCTGGTPSASAASFGSASNAFNNVTTDVSAWVTASSGYPIWIQYDFGSGNAKAIAEIGYWPESSDSYNRAPRDFIIQGSNDGSVWTNLKTYTGVTGWSAFGAGGGGYRTFSTT